MVVDFTFNCTPITGLTNTFGEFYIFVNRETLCKLFFNEAFTNPSKKWVKKWFMKNFYERLFLARIPSLEFMKEPTKG